jgi:hypothetical protein
MKSPLLPSRVLFVVVLAAAASLHAQSNTAPPALGLPRLESTAKANDDALLVADRLAIDDLCATGVAGGNTVASFAPPSSAAQANAPASAQPSPSQQPGPEARRMFVTLNHNPVQFFGRALDQFGESVAGAEVRGTLLINTGTSGGQQKAQTTTDGQGYFQFTGLKGQDLGIGISKEGYEYRRKTTSFSYTYFEADHKRHIPDPKNPVVFILWKKQGAEALVHYDRTWRFPVNSGPVRIDLVTGRIGGQDADLVVTVSRTPLQMPYGARGFAWSAIVEVEGGGLIRAGQRDYYNLAPESGYVPRFEHVQEAQDVRDAQEERMKWTWRESVSDDFFVSSRNGKNFARVRFYIRPNSDRKEGDNESAVEAEVWLNPNGSRNLEFDSKKAITPPP